MSNKLTIYFSFCIFQALLVLMLPIQWWCGAFLAALIHEAFHIFFIILCDGVILSASLNAAGAKIETGPMSLLKQALCILAGPLGSFLCLMVAAYFPELAICGLIQGCYNLLPFDSLDGGRVLRLVCSKPVCFGIECFILAILTGIGLWLITLSIELAVMILISAWYPMIQRKISCKERNLAVQ